MKEWKEEDHPRDDIGRFTKYGSIIPGSGKTDDRFKLSLDHFGKKTKSDESDDQHSVKIPPLPKEAYGFERLLSNHHQRHVVEMGLKDSKEYEKAAIDFWNNGEGNLYYCKRRGNFCKIADDGVTVCFCNSDGMIQSFYKYPNRIKTRQFMDLERLIKV